MKELKEIYLDHASTTPTDPRVLKEMLPYFSEKYGNPEVPHTKGKEALMAIDRARETIAKILNCRDSEIIFTGSATEANNLVIFGLAGASKKGTHIITSTIEHSSVRHPCDKLEEEGWEITRLKADKEGFVSPADLEKAITPQTALVSIMHANNEIGTIQPIEELGEICQKHNIPFHTDSCQTAGTHDLDVKKLKVDALTINGGKIYGPKGVGALYIKRGTPIEPIIYGGNHERGLRAGTHNTPGIIGLAKALELVQKEKDKENKRLSKLRDTMIEGILKNIPASILNGSKEKRLPGNINVTIPGIDAQELLLHLDQKDIYASSGAACTLGKNSPSNTLIAIGIPKKEVFSSIRISLGKQNTASDIEDAIKIMSDVCSKLRKRKP